MLKRMGETAVNTPEVRIIDAAFPAPFYAGLEFNAPARGPWNIVNTAMLLPEAHQIYVCAEGCLRGVVLTAAEMKAADRMSWVAMEENDLIGGNLERQILEGVTDILHKMGHLPRAVLIYISCAQLFAGCDFLGVLPKLRERFPGVDFVDCYMNPTMRKSGLTPDELTRRQIYVPLRKTELDGRFVNFIGNDNPTDESSELCVLLRAAGFGIRDLTRCKTYDEYLQMASSAYNLTCLPAAKAAGDALERRLGQRHLYIPLCYGREEILKNYEMLASALGISLPDFTPPAARADHALADALAVVGGTPVEIDYTAVPRPLGLARLLTEHGFRVRRVYADGFIAEEQADFRWLQSHTPELRICATVNPELRFRKARGPETVLAVGQKAAYFSGTRRFVNIVSGGGMYGFDGIARLAERMRDAFLHEKDTRALISRKGLGCESCL